METTVSFQSFMQMFRTLLLSQKSSNAILPLRIAHLFFKELFHVKQKRLSTVGLEQTNSPIDSCILTDGKMACKRKASSLGNREYSQDLSIERPSDQQENDCQRLGITRLKIFYIRRLSTMPPSVSAETREVHPSLQGYDGNPWIIGFASDIRM